MSVQGLGTRTIHDQHLIVCCVASFCGPWDADCIPDRLHPHDTQLGRIESIAAPLEHA